MELDPEIKAEFITEVKDLKKELQVITENLSKAVPHNSCLLTRNYHYS